MIGQQDLDAAVAAGVVTAAQRDALASFARDRQASALGADEEQFRFITSFNDIFVSIAVGLLLAAVAALAGKVAPAAGALAMAAVAWALAEYFTRQRRMALPSILLLIAFVGGVGAGVGIAGASLAGTDNVGPDTQVGALIMGAAAVSAVAAAALHWRRFQVPITMAAGAAAAVGVLVAIVSAIAGDGHVPVLITVALAGGGVFALAMRYDVSDRARTTRRTDIAFWLHLLAAPMMIHPLVVLSGLGGRGMDAPEAAAIIAAYVVLTVLALAIDRRALLVSALAYMIWAIQSLVQSTGAADLGFAVTALILGLFLVTLSAAWRPIRSRVVGQLPDVWATRLPVIA